MPIQVTASVRQVNRSRHILGRHHVGTTGRLRRNPQLDRLGLIDEYKILVHPRIAGHGPTLCQGGLPGTRRLELVSATPLRNGVVAMHYRRDR
ncbi:dihydrofolate reductase family protein [Microvirga lotononidis]|uniref:dihydrofolate reductase family protein n=1 Tax=Microvirga lotononidis TaxID=864069 RepID=UPI0002DF0E98|nr:dihydrofolate reductase family protein [Microvirga lotononidis]WQO30899.1 dihydrofolate reductase family protein [Microvirga lotononidis]